MNTFQRGDRVRVIADDNSLRNCTGTVTHFTGDRNEAQGWTYKGEAGKVWVCIDNPPSFTNRDDGGIWLYTESLQRI